MIGGGHGCLQTDEKHMLHLGGFGRIERTRPLAVLGGLNARGNRADLGGLNVKGLKTRPIPFNGRGRQSFLKKVQ